MNETCRSRQGEGYEVSAIQKIACTAFYPEQYVSIILSSTRFSRPNNQLVNQRSVYKLERRSNGMDEGSRLRGHEGYGVCSDDGGLHWFRRGQ